MKIVLPFVLLFLIIIPSHAYGWKTLIFHLKEECDVNCSSQYLRSEQSDPFNFIIIGIAFVIGITLFYKLNSLKKYEVFSLKCKQCGRSTNGLKCPFCN